MGDHRKLKPAKKKPKELKRSRPICTDEIQISDTEEVSPTSPTASSLGMGRKSSRDKDKRPKRGAVKERWLLTRKTWKYMTDAGRRLIPEGAHNRPEDIPKIVENFQHICRSEPRFVLWRRKCSYPGALANSRQSKRRLKHLSAARQPKSSSADEADDENKEFNRNAELVIKLLQNYLTISDQTEYRPSPYQEQVQLPPSSNFRENSKSTGAAKYPNESVKSSSYSASTTISPTASTSASAAKSAAILARGNDTDLKARTAELLDSLKSYTRVCNRPVIPPERINTDILTNKTLLRQIYNDLKQQQLQRILGRHTTHPTTHPKLPHASSLTSLWNFRRDSPKSSSQNSSQTQLNITTDHAYERSKNQLVPFISVKRFPPKKTFSTLGTQTDFIQLHALENMAKEYEAKKKELDLMNQTVEEEPEKSPTHHSRRKSSVDNEDVSQSVSDTIKRYLRMARKKSVNDDFANRFKRVNYDRNLRNIRAKGEINPPGMDEDNSKATQTLDAWVVLRLHQIRSTEDSQLLEEAHADWDQSLQQRKKNQQEYLQQLQQQQQQTQHGPNSSTTSPPPSPQPATGLFHSGTQFFSNLWHGYHHSTHDSTNSNTNTTSNANSTNTTTNTTSYTSTTVPTTINQQNNQTLATSPASLPSNSAAMQKSKSSSNVGQFVSKKIWKSRSKSQTRASNKPQWTPRGNCTWISSNGKRVILADARLRDLTEIERKILHRVAIEKINQLNIGVNVTAPGDVSSTSATGKSQKRRPLLIKRKALTTSIFDTSKKDENKIGSGLVFGVSLEKCVDNDNRLQKGLISDSHSSERGSRNSIISLLGGSSKGSDHIGSCESLPSRSMHTLGGQYDDSGGGGGGGGGNLINSSLIQVSRSQSDVRRNSQDEDDLLAAEAPPMAYLERNSGQQVPALVSACIKHLEEHGLNTVGIFRVSTSKKRVRQLKEDFDRGEVMAIDPEICPHDVATILKEYLRDLPEPLLCRNLYKAFVKTQKIRNRRLQLEALSHLIQLLPVAHRDTLYVLLRFLARIVRSSDDVTTHDGVVLSVGNKMDSNNLATVFAPNILRNSVTGRNTTEQEVDEQIDVINVIRTMIDHYEELFRVPAELMDEVYTNMMDTFPQQLDYLCEKRDVGDKLEDDMDSASSNTPLSSPPPVMLSHSSNFETGEQMPRKVYLREDFLHENAVKGDPNGNIAQTKRDRISKMKYQENEHELARRRRRERLASDTPSSPTKTTSKKVIKTHTFKQYDMSAEVSDENIDSDESKMLRSTGGIVKASLKIPVQMPSGALQHQNHEASGQLDLSGIPYIEDNGFGQEATHEGHRDEKEHPITGSLSFGGRRDSSTSITYQIPISYEGRILNSPSGSSTSSDPTRPHHLETSTRRSSDISQKLSTMPTVGTKPPDNIKRQSHAPSTTRSDVGQQQQHVMYIPSSAEPKISTSISNIGGAVLRSKTADFERISIQNKKYKANETADDQTDDTNDRSRRQSQGPIYKRQELISSAQRSSKQ